MAGSRTYRTKAIVLDKTKLKETDLILTLLAEDGAQLRAVAKGARKPGSRLAARCELFCTVDLLVARGRNLDVVSQAELIEAPFGASADYMRVSAASAVAEVAKACSYEDSHDPFAFKICLRCLHLLGGGGVDDVHADLLVSAYIFKLLAHSGYRPDFSYCVACGDPEPVYFSAQAGGLLCASCAKSIAGAEELDRRTAEWLKALLALTFDDLCAAEIDQQSANLLLALAHSWAATHLDQRLRSLEFYLGC